MGRVRKKSKQPQEREMAKDDKAFIEKAGTINVPQSRRSIVRRPQWLNLNGRRVLVDENAKIVKDARTRA